MHGVVVSRVLILVSVVAISLGAAEARASNPAEPLGLTDCGHVDAERVYQCSGLVETWDGVPLDTTVTLPAPRPQRLPLVVLLHGFGNSKHAYLDPDETAYTANAFAWARAGYAVLSYTARGFWGSCGTPESRLANPLACARGYIHLADVRYEVRDSQELIGRLVDAGLVDRRRIGVAGDSYGGGQSLMLAALRDRMMLPDGRLARWRSPAGAPLEIAAAAPVIPWSDLVYAIAPNGRVSANGITGRATATTPVGVQKATVMNAIFAAATVAIGPGQPVGQPFVPGRPMGFLAPPGLDPSADVIGWVARTNAGEPYTDPLSRSIVREATGFRSAYYISPGRRPAPLLLGSGFTDDLFPVDEVLRYANRTRKRHPRSPLRLLLGDFGHQRASNKPAERARLIAEIRRFFDHHLRDRGRPRRGVTAFVQTCPRDRRSGGPFTATRFSRLSGRKLRFTERRPRSILSIGGGDPTVALAIDPATGGGDGCVQTARSTAPGTARYTLIGPARRGVTMIGAPRLRADLTVRGAEPSTAQIASRLWDVAPDRRTQRLVARGFYRPEQGANVWQLHPGSWRFARGHSAELELLGHDAPFGRPSNGLFEVEVRNLRVRVPVR